MRASREGMSPHGDNGAPKSAGRQVGRERPGRPTHTGSPRSDPGLCSPGPRQPLSHHLPGRRPIRPRSPTQSTRGCPVSPSPRLHCTVTAGDPACARTWAGRASSLQPRGHSWALHLTLVSARRWRCSPVCTPYLLQWVPSIHLGKALGIQ